MNFSFPAAGDHRLALQAEHMTRIDAFDSLGHLAGVFITVRPAVDAAGLPPSGFASWEGEWWPAGGCDWTEEDWFLKATTIEVVALPTGENHG